MATLVEKAIINAKRKLITKAEKSGICENFGQDVVRKLTSHYVLIGKQYGSGADAVNQARRAIAQFDNWCMNYTGTGEY